MRYSKEDKWGYCDYAIEACLPNGGCVGFDKDDKPQQQQQQHTTDTGNNDDSNNQ